MCTFKVRHKQSPGTYCFNQTIQCCDELVYTWRCWKSLKTHLYCPLLKFLQSSVALWPICPHFLAKPLLFAANKFQCRNDVKRKTMAKKKTVKMLVLLYVGYALCKLLLLQKPVNCSKLLSKSWKSWRTYGNKRQTQPGYWIWKRWLHMSLSTNVIKHATDFTCVQHIAFCKALVACVLLFFAVDWWWIEL